MAVEEQTDVGVLFASISGGSSWGQKLTITNRTVTKLSFYLIRVGSPGGILTFLIRAVSGDAILLTKLWGNSNNISTSAAWYEVTFDSSLFINEEVYILATASAGSGGNLIQVYKTSSNVKDNEFVVSRNSGGVYNEIRDPDDAPYIYTYDEGGSTTPVVTTQAATDVIATGATGHGNIQGLGSSAVTQHGHVWSTSQSPDTSDSKTELGAKPQAGAFASLITGLTPGNTYYIKAYATNSSGTAYGSQVSITTETTIRRAHIWSEGKEFHYFDEAGVERVLQGHATASDKDIWPWLDPFS